jgi:hypothetical protein
MKIFVFRHGWVFVGTLDKDNKNCIKDARCVRVWGTKNGLSELANNGPTAETKLENICVINYNPLDLLFTLDCNIHKWKCCGCGCHES